MRSRGPCLCGCLPEELNSRSKKTLFGLIAAAIALIVAAAVTEVTLRALGFRFDCSKGVILAAKDTSDHRFGTNAIIDDPCLFLRFVPNSSFGGFKFNSHGLRGPDFPDKKPPGTIRVMGLGDSNVFGLGAKVENTFPSWVARMLASETGAKPIESILAGVPAYTSLQSRNLFVNTAQYWDPDLVLVYFGAYNDYQRSRYYTDAELVKANLVPRRGYRNLLIWQVVHKCALRVRQNIRGRPPRVSLKEFADNIRDVARICAKRNIPCILIVPGLPAATLRKYPKAPAYQRMVVQVGRELGLPVCDISKEFALKGKKYLGDAVHINEAGHRRVAEHVMVVLRKLPFYEKLCRRGGRSPTMPNRLPHTDAPQTTGRKGKT